MAIESDIIHKRLLDVAGEFGFLSDNATLLLEHVAEDIANHPTNADVPVAEEPTYVLSREQVKDAVVKVLHEDRPQNMSRDEAYEFGCQVADTLGMEG